MRPTFVQLVAGGVSLLLTGGPPAAASQPRAKNPPADRPASRPFIGTFQITPERREALMRYIEKKGFKGAFVPDGAAPDTLLYRGTRAEYEAAWTASWKYKDLPQEAGDAGPADGPTPAVMPYPTQDEEAPGVGQWKLYNQLGISPLQKELLQKFSKEADERVKVFPKTVAGNDEMVAKGAEYNRWMRKSLRDILTRDQYARLWKLWGAEAPAAELGPEPKLPPPDGTQKTEEAIMKRLGLSAKQEEHFKKHLDIRDKAIADLKRKPSPAAAEMISQKWRAALDHVLTKDQRKAYSQYWGPPGRVIGG